jgi:hypothetical protein
MYNTTSFNSIVTNPGTNLISSFQITTNGLYLFQWQIQTTYTSAITYFYSNIANSSISNTATSPTVVPGNWGQQPIGTVLGGMFMTTSGSFLGVVTPNNYYNLVLNVSGGGTLSALIGYYYAIRIA